jgi:hypothetical protein
VIDVQNIPSGVRVLVGSAEVLAQLYPELKGKIAA